MVKQVNMVFLNRPSMSGLVRRTARMATPRTTGTSTPRARTGTAATPATTPTVWGCA